MNLVDRVTALFHDFAPAVDAPPAASAPGRRHLAYLAEVEAAFADAQHLDLAPCRDILSGDIHPGALPAVEYYHSTGEVRLCNVLDPAVAQDATLTKALAIRRDIPAAEAELLDVKPEDRAPIEYAAINLGPVQEFRHAAGQRWRFFVEYTTCTVAAGIGAGIHTHRLVADCTL
jgi:hypothetical protein